MRKLILLAPIMAAALAGCQNLGGLTPAQQAQVFCVLSAEGTTIGVALTKGGAQATARQAADAQVVVCDAATRIGQSLTPPVK